MSPERREKFAKLDDVVRENFFKGRVNPWMVAALTKWPDSFNYLDETLPHRQLQIKAFGELLRRIRRIGARYDCRMITVMLPEGAFVNREACTNWRRLGFDLPEDLYGNQAPVRATQAACKRAGVPFIDMQAPFREHGEETGLFFKLDTHMTAAGHRLLAECLFPPLSKEVP
jgi:hypothetical protein